MEGLEPTASQPPQWLLVSIFHRVICLFSLLYSEPLTHTAPSAAPSNVRATSTSSSVTVQWGMVPCIHRNGEITGYSVRYGDMGSGSPQTVTVSEREVTIQDLMSSTTYSIEVAAVNSAGVGVYSYPIKTTKSKPSCIKLFNSSTRIAFLHLQVSICVFCTTFAYSQFQASRV